jgi:hypothetical protein
MWIIQYNKKLYTEFKDLALNSIHYKLPDMYKDSLPFRIPNITSENGGHWQSARGSTKVGMGGRCDRRRCQSASVSQLEADSADRNSLEAEIMGGRGLNTDCSAAGGME